MRLPAAGSARTLWIIALTAVVSLTAGLGLSRLIISPAEAAADTEPPEAGPITVPVEERMLANDVVLRGDAIYEDPASVTIETGDLGGPAVVTGQVPEVGATLEAGDVMLEITGRPVILLEGELPVYRTLRAGVSGPDVLQLKAALGALGIDVGNPGDTYDSGTAAAVAALYERVGYPAPTAGEEATAALDAARDGVRMAEEQVAVAQRGLNDASAGTPQSERIRLQTEVNSAKHRLDAARSACDNPTDEMPCDQGEIIAADGAYAVAVAARDEGNAAPDTSSARSELAAAQRMLADARDDLAAAQRAVVTPLPAGEVVYLTSAPRRVDSVDVSRGSTVAGGAVMSVSGATLQIAGSVARTDAALIAEGAEATITLPGGEEVTGTVTTIGAPAPSSDDGSGGSSGSSDAGRERLIIEPGDLTEDQRAELQGSNVRIRIPVSSTGGEVLAVPIAALTAGPGGESRVEVLGDGEETTLVTVEPGLAAGGFVEVTPLDGSLEVGDRVVVGQSQGQVSLDGEESTDDAPADGDGEDSGGEDEEDEDGASG